MLSRMVQLEKAMTRSDLSLAIMRFSQISKLSPHGVNGIYLHGPNLFLMQNPSDTCTKRQKRRAPFSVDANLLHISAEGKVLEDPAIAPEEYVFSRTVSPEEAPDIAEEISIQFVEGDPVALNGEMLSPASLLTRLNELGGKHGIGRLDLVENRFVGMKSRGIYETPGGTGTSGCTSGNGIADLG